MTASLLSLRAKRSNLVGSRCSSRKPGLKASGCRAVTAAALTKDLVAVAKLARSALTVRFADARRLTRVAIVAHGGGSGDETPIREGDPATFRPQSQPCA